MTSPSSPVFNRPDGLGCCAGEDLTLVGTAPGVGPFPELRTFRCRRCGHVETIETPRGAER
jgi:hypothetical protein